MGTAQEPGATAPPASPAASTDRPGLWHWGAFWVTPRFRLGTIGIDTNVFYTPTDRRTDFHASGGPGIETVLPLGAARLILDGNLIYVYFAKTESQRRLAGDGKARLEVGRGRARAGMEEAYAHAFERPSYEVDLRVSSETWITRADLAIDFSQRTGIRAEASRQQFDVPRGQDFYGTDVGESLTRDINRVIFSLQYRITPKTALVAEGDYQQDRFRFSSDRNSDSNRIYGGFEVTSTTRLSGRAVGGVRLFRPQGGPGRSDKQSPYVNVNLTYTFGPSTTLSGGYLRDMNFSAFDPQGATPTVDRRTVSARLEKRFLGQASLWIYGAYDTFVTDGPITVIDGQGNATTGVRDDKTWSGGADLGYYFRRRLRIGVAATYTERNSTFDDFGIKGLLFGGTVNYNPN
jgi:Putative beta-barrel porin 2